MHVLIRRTIIVITFSDSIEIAFLIIHYSLASFSISCIVRMTMCTASYFYKTRRIFIKLIFIKIVPPPIGIRFLCEFYSILRYWLLMIINSLVTQQLYQFLFFLVFTVLSFFKTFCYWCLHCYKSTRLYRSTTGITALRYRKLYHFSHRENLLDGYSCQSDRYTYSHQEFGTL